VLEFAQRALDAVVRDDGVGRDDTVVRGCALV
jgi:hypothetical protein